MSSSSRSPSTTQNLLVFLLLAYICGSALAFSPSARGSFSHRAIYQNSLSRHCLDTTSVATEEASDDAVTMKDAKGKEIFVGAVVRVVADNLKAYQVPAKGQGSYDENKKFVPAPKGGERSSRNLVLPVGIRGVVTRIYDVEDVSANHPIQVKFTPGENIDEGYDPPVAFLMHFDVFEVECV